VNFRAQCAARVVVLLFAALGCGRRSHAGAGVHKAEQVAVPSARRLAAADPSATKPNESSGPWLQDAWDPRTGRGIVTHHQPGQGTMRTSFHVGYPGYTGGLVIGGYSSSGLAWVPEQPKPGFPSINVFCAQDESIWDRDERREYTYGWSENYGTGPDGERLEYVSGRVIESTRERVVLESENAGGCYHVRKVASTWASTQFWVIATRISNRCNHSVHFDFFSGDDPWIGLYKSSDGDVGWTPSGVVRSEQRFELGEFTAGGLWDLGNAALGQSEGTFSNQADFFALDPTLALPDEANFANRFAHRKSEVDPSKALDNHTMTALNLGWTNQELAPQSFRDFAFALGLAVTSDASTVPRLPELSDEHWSRWRKRSSPKTGSVRDSAEFVAELVELDISRESMQVHGIYYVNNPTTASAAFTIGFPINVAAERPAPETVLVDGHEAAVVPESSQRVSASFSISVPALSVRSFDVRYTQPHRGRRAEYVVTSALTWKRPLDRAVFRIRAAAELGPVRTSYPARIVRSDSVTRNLTIVRQPFVPDREMTITW
jgi:hypothetical protein